MWRFAAAAGVRARAVAPAVTLFAASGVSSPQMTAQRMLSGDADSNRGRGSRDGRGRGHGRGRGRGRGREEPPVTVTAASRAASPAAASAAIVSLLQGTPNGEVNLGLIISAVTPDVRNAIIASGKGLEGFVKQFSDRLEVRVEGTERHVALIGEARADFERMQAEATADAQEPAEEVAAGAEQPVSDEPVQPPAAVQEETSSPSAAPAAPEGSTPAAASAEAADAAAPAATADAAAPAATADAAAPAESADAEEGADGNVQEPAKPAAAQQPQKAQPEESESPGKDAHEGLSAAMAAEPSDPNIETRKRVLALIPLADTWYLANDVYQTLYRGSTEVPYSDFVLYLRGSPDYYWFHKGTVTRRLPRHRAAPEKIQHLVVSVENIRRGTVTKDGRPSGEIPAQAPPAEQATAKKSSSVAFSSPAAGPPKVSTGPSDRPAAGAGLHEVPTAVNNYGGWGAAANVPTSADVFEILKFVPVHWVQFGDLNLPKETKKRHIRTSKALAWFARQPRYFDLRVASGTIEVRRSVLLHPEQHGMSKEEAEEVIQKRIQADKEAGEPVPLIAARAAPETRAPKAKGDPGLPSVGSSGSAAVDATTKILLRVCPGYYVTANTIIRRATKKLELLDLVTAADMNKNHLDVLTVTNEQGPTKVTHSFLRRKTGIEASKWESEFIGELSQSPNLDALVDCMTRACAQWDRLHFLYVRLPDETKAALGGFDGMTDFLRAHPHVFLVGEYFVKRIDPSDPSFDATEPDSNAITSTKMLEDNPYHLSKELAAVFHYLAPEDQPCSLSHFVECCSPAMKSVLPPRLITVVQSHPELLSYREVSPGTYAVSRASEVVEGGAKLSAEDTVDEVVKLVPPRGIDASHLMNSLDPSMHANVVRHFGQEGIHELVARNLHLFHVVRNPPYVTLFLKKPRRTQD